MKAGSKEIVIVPDSLLTDIQAAFSAYYPFLMIEFFQNSKSLLTHKHAKIDSGISVKRLANPDLAHAIDVNSERTVSAVLQDFIAVLGVIVRMCRKSGKVWNAISLTDGWTLERQNTAGEYISSVMTGEEVMD